MKSTKILLLLLFTVMLIVPIAYAGWFSDWITGWQTGTRETNLSISVGNTNPVVNYVQDPGTQTVTEYPGAATTVTFEVHVYDADGSGNIDTSATTANITILGGNSEVREDTSCSSAGNIDANTENFTCSIDIVYWDTPGNWNITAYGADISSGSAINDTEWFQLQDTTAIKISPDQVTFPSSNPGATTVQSDNDPTRINNTANHNVSANDLTVTAIDLYGASDQNYWIPAANFTVNVADACSGDAMVNGSAQSITGYVLEPGNLSAGEAYEELYYCIEHIPPTITQQTYDTTNGGSWEIIAS